MESLPAIDPLALAQARWLIGDLVSDELADVAVDLIQRGYECAAFWELAGTMSRDLAADGPALFDRAMQELGLKPLGEADAALIVARHAAAECLAGRTTPEEFAAHAFGVARNAHYPESSRKSSVYTMNIGTDGPLAGARKLSVWTMHCEANGPLTGAT